MSSSVSQGRESNFELARIIAMLFVLWIHADFLSFGEPTTEDCILQPYPTLFKFFVESMTFVCVDLFVLISGWFGIKPTLKKGVNLLCTTLFYSLLVFIVFAVIQGRDSISLASIKNALLLNKGYWFIKCYLFLMILSPVLNAFVESSGKKLFRTVLVVLFAFQCYFGWTNATYDYSQGCSSIFFIFLYLLGRYISKYQKEYCSGGKKFLLIYAIITLALTLLSFVATRYSFIPSSLVGYSFNYLNPLVILSALALMLFFYNLKFSSKAVNWVASSSLAVYLIHANEMVLPIFEKTVLKLSGQRLPVICIFLFTIAVFAVSVLIDKIRSLLFKQFGLS